MRLNKFRIFFAYTVTDTIRKNQSKCPNYTLIRNNFIPTMFIHVEKMCFNFFLNQQIFRMKGYK